MYFLRKLFGARKAAPRVKRSKSRKEIQLHNYSGFSPAKEGLGKDMEIVQQKSSKLLSAPPPNFCFKEEASLLLTRLVDFNEKTETVQTPKIDWGSLVGIINKQKNTAHLAADSIQISIGRDQEINCLTALRPKSLDSLVVFWGNGDCQFPLDQILRSQQRFIFILDSWQQVKAFVVDYQQSMLQRFGDSPVVQCSGKMLLNLTYFSRKFIVTFEDEKKFTKKFISRIKQIFPFLELFEEVEQIARLMTLQEYKECRLMEKSGGNMKGKVQSYKSEIEEMLEGARKKEELAKIELMIEAEMQKELERIPEPVRKNSSFEAELQAEYFGKRESQNDKRQSQKETRESGSRRPENEELYYFIEQRDSSTSNQRSCDNTTNPKQLGSSRRQQKSPRRMGRSKSWNSLSEAKEQQLDEQFFEKQ